MAKQHNSVRRPSIRSAPLLAVVGLTGALALVCAGALPAQAAVGDQSNAAGQYLSGSLLGSDLTQWVGLGGVTASSTGTTSQTNADPLDLSVLGDHVVSVPGGLQIPISGADAGVAGQYASASTSASSVGASGLIGADGAIGTGVEPAPGVAPLPLAVNLSQVVGGLGFEPPLLAEIGNLSVTAGVTSASASQTAPAAATGAYSIAGANITFASPTLAALGGVLTDQIAALQSSVDALGGTTGSLSTALDALPISLLPLDVLSSSTTLSGDPLAVTLPTTLSSLQYPGVSINLASGTVSVDLSALHALNAQLPGTQVFTTTEIETIAASVTGLVTDFAQSAEVSLAAQVGAIGISSQTEIAGGLAVVSIDSTIAGLLSGSAGITLLNGGLLLAGGADAVSSLLGTALAVPGTTLAGLTVALIDPVVAIVSPAITQILGAALSLTVNNQSTVNRVFSETALRITVLPLAGALTLDLANARVGANSVAEVIPPVVVPPSVVPPAATLPDTGSSSAGVLATTGTNAQSPLLLGGFFVLAGVLVLAGLGARRVLRARSTRRS